MRGDMASISQQISTVLFAGLLAYVAPYPDVHDTQTAHYGRGTEQFIPLGQSPGLSREGKTVIGILSDIDAQHKRIVIGCQEVQLSAKTMIYIDRSKLGQSSTIGTWADLMMDSKVEAYLDIWIKIQRE